ncbi:MAG TPA: GatB/YqeY domain-containing protein [Iamia sp.]
MLAERIQTDLTASMKARDQLTTTVLRSVLAAIKEARVADGAADELSDADVEALIKREAKKRDEAATAFADAGRAEQAAQERAEGEILARYLPQPLTEAELDELVGRVLEAGGFTTPKDMGAAMKAVQAEVAGRADGKVVSGLVRTRLAGS